MFALFLDIFQTPTWKDFQDSIPSHLLGVVDEVKQTVFVARADGTVRTFLEALTAGNAGQSRTAFPICRQIRSTLQCIYKSFCKVLLLLPPSNKQSTLYIDWVHGLAGCLKVSSHCMVQSMMRLSMFWQSPNVEKNR